VGTKSVDLANLHARYEYVPIMIGTVGEWIDGDDTRGASILDPIKKQQFNPLCTPRED
jgi:hypothetical protein